MSDLHGEDKNAELEKVGAMKRRKVRESQWKKVGCEPCRDK